VCVDNSNVPWFDLALNTCDEQYAETWHLLGLD